MGRTQGEPRPAGSARRRGVSATLLALAGVLLILSCTNRDVVGVVVGTITVRPGIASLVEGESLQFEATVEDATGRILPRAEVIWSSEAPASLAVDDEGMGEALLADTTTPEERGRAVGTNDMLAGAITVGTPFMGGVVVASLGLMAVGLVGAALALTPMFLLGRLKELSPGRYEGDTVTQ